MNVPPTPDPLPNEGGLFGGYQPSAQVYDEVASAPGLERRHWKTFLSSFERLGTEELRHRWENARRIIRDHGVTYNVYGDPQGMDRPWDLDMVPLLIPPEEWARIESGLKQRSRLFNLILADLYGQQRLLRAGLLPPALVFANPGFLRACHGIRPTGNVFLHLQAADLARSPEGQWWVLGDRTQAPSGAGYALENRIVLSRVLPDEFRDCRVQRLASFFRFLRDTLRGLAPRDADNPNVVLLTPGPYNETFFEHAYLARYLGFAIVEGGDLTVRDRKVFVKTLEGLQPVDVILRRVDDSFCDPLELRDDSFLGVAGLVEAARAGNVTIANALGSGIMESPAFLAFLPSLCRHLLGEELELPSVATWWCGQGTEQRYVFEHLEETVVKPAFGAKSRPPFFGDKLDAEQRARLMATIEARPYDFIGQEQVALSTAPVWAGDKLEARPVVLRAYVATGSQGSEVMPGGLTRVSSTPEELIVSMQKGGGSKDTWILSDEPVHSVSLLTQSGQPTIPSRTSYELPSRVADNLFWLGRYAERLEDLLRLLRSVFGRLADEASSENSASSLAQMLVDLQILPREFQMPFQQADFEKELLLLVYAQDRVGGVRELSGRIRNLASIVRDRFSLDTWRILNQLQTHTKSRPGRLPVVNAVSILNTLIGDLAAFSGVGTENMTRGHGWRFLDLGRRLERSYHLTKLLNAGVGANQSTALLETILEIADSSMTYRRRYFAQPQLQPVLEVLLYDPTNPRSLGFQLKALEEHARNLPAQEERADEHSVISNLLEELSACFARALREQPETELKPDVQTFLQHCAQTISMLSDRLTNHYFNHTLPQLS